MALWKIGRALQVTPVLTQDARPLPEVTISQKDGRPARQPTGRRRLKKADAVDGRPYPPGRDYRTGQLWTLMIPNQQYYTKSHSEVTKSNEKHLLVE